MGRRYVRHRLYMVRPVQAGSVKPRRPVSTPGRTHISENLPASRKDKEYGIDGKLYGVKWDDEPEHEGNTSEIKTRIAVNGEELIALRNPDGSVGFIRSELLKPVEGELNKEFAQICVRPANQDCRFIYAVKDGMILRALIAPMNIKDDVADDLDEIIAELMSRRQQNIVKKMHDDLQDVIAQETAEKAAQVENEQE